MLGDSKSVVEWRYMQQVRALLEMPALKGTERCSCRLLANSIAEVRGLGCQLGALQQGHRQGPVATSSGRRDDRTWRSRTVAADWELVSTWQMVRSYPTYVWTMDSC